jgi:hypothetical protein
MKNPPKDAVNPHFKSRYADLATVRDTVVPVMAKHGLAVMQLPCDVDGLPALTTLVVHTSGEWVETTILLRPTKNDPQGVGSALTYMRRYALQSIAGVAADDDDDGNAGSHHPAQSKATANHPPTLLLRKDFEHWLAEAKDRDRVMQLSVNIGAAKGANDLTEADCEYLRPLVKAALARFNQPAPAKS